MSNYDGIPKVNIEVQLEPVKFAITKAMFDHHERINAIINEEIKRAIDILDFEAEATGIIRAAVEESMRAVLRKAQVNCELAIEAELYKHIKQYTGTMEQADD